jgi:hypothetical protein
MHKTHSNAILRPEAIVEFFQVIASPCAVPDLNKLDPNLRNEWKLEPEELSQNGVTYLRQRKVSGIQSSSRRYNNRFWIVRYDNTKMNKDEQEYNCKQSLLGEPSVMTM